MPRYIAAALAVAIAPFLVPEAEAAVIEPGGTTSVEVRYSFGALPISATPTGIATVDTSGSFPVFSFPITGGTADGGVLLIEHEGSGVALSDGITTASVGNFVVDTMLAEVRGDVTGGPQDFPLFDLGTTTANGIQVFLSDELEGALEAAFGRNLPSGLFGFANTSPTIAPEVEVIPLPAALPLLAGGLALFGVVATRRHRA